LRSFAWTILIAGYVLPYSAHAQNNESHDPEKVYKLPAEEAVRNSLAQWQELKFGLFMHWGTYSQWGIVESWTLCPDDYPFTQRKGPDSADYFAYKKSYENLQHTFNPTRFDPTKWAAIAKDAGMKYVVFTAKHHDGFCMYDTRYTDYRITSPNTPFSANKLSNITKEVFDAFRKKDFMVGAYFSKPDWHSENYWWPYFPPKDRFQNYDIKKYPERWKKFGEYTYNQIEELVSGYGKLDLLWIDGNWAELDMQPIVSMTRRHQPGLIVVDRHGKPEFVNYLTPEQKVPDHYIEVPWETCMTMGLSWSYIREEKYKPTRQLVQLLIDIVAKNGNLLLGIGPGPDGEWHEEAYQRLREIGQWIKLNGESIYATRPAKPYRSGKWAFTKNERSVFISYLPEENEKELPASFPVPLPDSVNINKSVQVQLLGDSKNLKWKKENNGLIISIPETTRKKLGGQPAWVFKVYSKQ
jgi:alpha-L-fucosidase